MNQRPRCSAASLAATIAVLLVGLTMLLPFAWMISASLKKPGDVIAFPVIWIPSYWYPDNYRHIFTMKNSVWLMYWNSIKVTGINVAGSLLLSSLAAYAYAKMRFWGRDAFFLIVLATLMIPSQAIFVPKFVLFTWMNRFIPMINSHNALILPGLFSALGLFLLRQFFAQVPNEISEAALIDGAGDLTIWARIMMPIARPGVASYIILVFINHWNDYESPLIFIRNAALATIPLGLSLFRDENGLAYHYIMALSTIAILPVFTAFLLGQKQFVRGLTAGAVKG
jgi:multiple sugar transport system permease protein